MKNTKTWKLRNLRLDATTGRIQIHKDEKNTAKPRRVITLDQLRGAQPHEVVVKSQYDSFAIVAEDSEPDGLTSFLNCLAAYLPELCDVDGVVASTEANPCWSCPGLVLCQ
jgi:hypothetical protein